jgi:hypothetical protein
MIIETGFVMAQDLGQIGKAKLFKLTGGIAANAVFYEGDANREAFTYFLSGNINLNISNVYNIPFSFSYSNQEFANSNPFSFNRLSIHPSYKWVTAHIGDVNMNFSPYTLSGHQFTGLGVDLTPEGKWKISAMYGRLLKAVEYDANAPESQPAYERVGYGLKVGYDFGKFFIGGILFKATDDANSLKFPLPLNLEVQANANAVVSVETRVQPFEKAQINAEMAVSTLTEDTNAQGEHPNANVLSSLLETNVTTNQYKAFNLGFSYAIGQGTVGVNYERIDPEYRTLGAYFFNNDLENINVNAAQTILNNKVNVSMSGGVQRDDLDNTKSSQLQRFVSAVTVVYTPNERFNATGGYSNFQSFTNIKDQFELINEVAQTDNLDTLNFQQISQNANLNLNYALKDTDIQKKHLALALSFQNAVNKQDGTTVENGDSKFYNANLAYALGYPKQNFTVSASANLSYNTLGAEASTTYGPIISVGKQFFDKQLSTNGSVSYNNSLTNGSSIAQVTNLRLGSTYSYKKKHNLNLNILSQFRGGTNATNNFTVTLGYNYIFDKFKPNIKFPKRHKKEKKPKTKAQQKSSVAQTVQFRYKETLYKGTLPQVNIQLQRKQNEAKFDYIPTYKKGELAILRQEVAQEKEPKAYKMKALEFLKQLHSYSDFLEIYEQLIFETMLELQTDMNQLDYAYENAYVEAIIKAEAHKLHKLTPQARTLKPVAEQNTYKAAVKKAKTALGRLISHRWMLEFVMTYKSLKDLQNPDVYLEEVLAVEKENIFRKWDQQESHQKLQLYIITSIIDFYIKKSVNNTNPEQFELKYIKEK